jgi:putative flavoprotein involved in K+ transport
MRSACVVVGAGPAGVAVSTALAGAGVDHVVLERNDVADTWRRQRWDSFRLNTPGWMNTTLGPVAPDSFSSRDEVVRLLAERARALPVRSHTPVIGLEHNGAGFVVQTDSERIDATTVVLAIGLQNVAKVPAATAQFPPRLHQLHTADYANAADLPAGAVLVVGSAQSGCQIAEDLVLAGRRVYLATSRVGRYRWMYRGRELIGWLVDCGHWDQRPCDLADPGETRAAIAVVGSGGHSLDLPLLARLGVTLLGRLESVLGERITCTDSLLDHIAYADTVAAVLESKADSYIAQHAIPAPEPDIAPDVGLLPLAPITELDLAAEGITSVIWATGFTADLSWVGVPILDDHGYPRHDRCASPVPGLWYIGFPWLTRRQSGILYGLPGDAAEVVAGVLHHLGHRDER